MYERLIQELQKRLDEGDAPIGKYWSIIVTTEMARDIITALTSASHQHNE